MNEQRLLLIEELKNMKTENGYCSYTKDLQDAANIYVLNGTIIKNRDSSYKSKNIIIEKDKIIDIYCEKEKLTFYKQIIEKIKNYGTSYITIHNLG